MKKQHVSKLNIMFAVVAVFLLTLTIAAGFLLPSHTGAASNGGGNAYAANSPAVPTSEFSGAGVAPMAAQTYPDGVVYLPGYEADTANYPYDEMETLYNEIGSELTGDEPLAQFVILIQSIEEYYSNSFGEFPITPDGIPMSIGDFSRENLISFGPLADRTELAIVATSGSWSDIDNFLIIGMSGGSVEFFNGGDGTSVAGTPFEVSVFAENAPVLLSSLSPSGKNYIGAEDYLLIISQDSNGYFYQNISFGADYLELIPQMTYDLPPDPVKEGYDFVGWYLDEDLTEPYDGRIITENITLYAKFQIKTFTVTFNANGGDALPSQTVDWNTSPTLPTPTRADTNYTFSHWESNGTEYTGAPVMSNITLVAVWDEFVAYEIIFETAGGDPIDNLIVPDDTVPTLPTPTRTGYNFMGWTLNGTAYTPGVLTSDITLRATWKIIRVTVTFVVDGEVYETVEVAYGTSFPELVREAGLTNYALYDIDGARVMDENFDVSENLVFAAVSEGETIEDEAASWFSEFYATTAGQIVVPIAAGLAVNALIFLIVFIVKKVMR